MPAPRNRLKAALEEGETQVGLWLALASGPVAEIAGRAGFDWCLIDAEHGPNTLTTIEAQLQALAGTEAAPVVRVPAGEDWMLKQVLDLGVQTILVPMVDDAETAARMARAVRYPSFGTRGMGAILARASGYGAMADYVTTANDEICLIVQAESAAALRNLDAICATDGVDAVFVGPADLSADMGYPGQPDHPEVTDAIADAIERITDAGKPAGIVTFDPSEAGRYRDMGVTFLGVGGDSYTLTMGLRALLGAVRRA